MGKRYVYGGVCGGVWCEVTPNQCSFLCLNKDDQGGDTMKNKTHHNKLNNRVRLLVWCEDVVMCWFETGVVVVDFEKRQNAVVLLLMFGFVCFFIEQQSNLYQHISQWYRAQLGVQYHPTKKMHQYGTSHCVSTPHPTLPTTKTTKPMRPLQ